MGEESTDHGSNPSSEYNKIKLFKHRFLQLSAARMNGQLGWAIFFIFAATFCMVWLPSLRDSGIKVPGPRGIPIFGSILEDVVAPCKVMYQAERCKLRNGHAKIFEAWTHKYQDIFRVVLGRKEVVILNTRAAIAKTLIKQGASYQTRPEWDLWHETFVHSANTGGVLTIGTSRWSANVSKLRKTLGPHTTAQKLPRRYHRLVKLLSESTVEPKDHGYTWWSTTVGLVTDSLVGFKHDDDFVKLICETEIGIFRLRALGFPFSDWVPLLSLSDVVIKSATSILSRASSLLRLPTPDFLLNEREDKCNKLRSNQATYCCQQLAGLTERLKNGDQTPSQLGDMFRSLPEPLPYREQYLLMTTLAGSGMAIGSTLNWLMGYLASHPEYQDKAYDAINSVYNGAVPDPHDTDRVEYLKAIAIEAGRYWTPVRLGFLRETDKDSQIDEFFLPKGTMVVYNSYQINRDSAAYDRPDQFIPERWMNGHQGRTDTIDVVDKIGVPHMGHGAGRRLCLGVPGVNKSFYGVLSLALHFFKFERAELGEDGMKTVFPSFRACSQSSSKMDPIEDQISPIEAQGLPRATGIRVTARNPEQLSAWLDKGHSTLQDWNAPWE
ncbi:3-hydroxyphenylacetate 6-hydroxylase [Paramyrothecium foliicola]|nr:3-hydroxyphenylacetate 6-hydroxylase [Paramyrothecium foliicola]